MAANAGKVVRQVRIAGANLVQTVPAIAAGPYTMEDVVFRVGNGSPVINGNDITGSGNAVTNKGFGPSAATFRGTLDVVVPEANNGGTEWLLGVLL